VKLRGDGDKKGTARASVKRQRRTETKKQAIDYDAAVRQIWNNRSSWAAGFEPERWLAECAAIELERISSWPGAKSDFEGLSKEGCHPYILGLLLFFLRYSPQIESALANFTGSGKKREAVARRLEKTASLLEHIFSRLPSDANAAVAGLFTNMGNTAPLQQAIGLRLTAQFIRLAGVLSRRKMTQVSLYVLSSYVEKSTGSQHDAMVSGLIAAVRSNHYDEDAHNSWRSRNMRRISSGAVGDWHIAEFLVGLNKLLVSAAR
jgi:hypothetical protein